MLDQLRNQQEFDDASVRIMLDGLHGIDGEKKNPKGSGGNDNLNAEKPKDKSIVEMELQPYEHYDYIMIVCKTTFDWNWLTDRFNIVKKYLNTCSLLQDHCHCDLCAQREPYLTHFQLQQQNYSIL